MCYTLDLQPALPRHDCRLSVITPHTSHSRSCADGVNTLRFVPTTTRTLTLSHAV